LVLLRCSRRVLLLLCVCYADCLQLDGEALDPPRPLPWYPDNLAWHLAFSRNQLRKLSWLSDIHEFMKSANEHGSITRQEAVSMVPPLLLDVQPHHKVC
jgi:16S rRNA C967 or C1407 C5-methylase (RsmB/RsmF family)